MFTYGLYRIFKGIKTCYKKAIILFWATMAIKKHLNIAYVARSEETSWKMWHRQGQMTEIVFVFEDRIGFWSRSWMTELRFAEFASFCEWFLHIYRRYLFLFIDLIAWIHSICINSVEFSNIFYILKTYDVIPCVCPLIDHDSRPMKSHEFLRLLYNKHLFHNSCSCVFYSLIE